MRNLSVKSKKKKKKVIIIFLWYKIADVAKLLTEERTYNFVMQCKSSDFFVNIRTQKHFHNVLKITFILFLFTIIRSRIPSDIHSETSKQNSPLAINPYDTGPLNYTSSSEESGNNMNITLHQSIVDINMRSIANATDPLNNTFNVEAPTDNTFNVSNIRIEVSDLEARNKSITINDQWDTQHKTKYTHLEPAVTSFQTPIDGYLNNVTLYAILDAGGSTNSTVVIYNSTWDSANNQNLPGDGTSASLSNYTVLGQYELLKGTLEASWFEILDSGFYLNNSKTSNNTWFIGLWRESESSSSQPKWAGIADTGGYPYCYWWDGSTWATTYDHAMKLVITTKTYIDPPPEELNLQINGTNVIGYPNGNGTGYWISDIPISASSGKITFEVSSDWWWTRR